ncbi:hypothetical protein [Bradyrhizobium ottawaense]|uniref:hypothetical protein n=1 Tax=Bradyrhizobium ottawaense TaxID=931866 RepID=UPI003FA0901F
MNRPRLIIYRANDPDLRSTLEVSHQCIAESMKILQHNEPPDTFLGRPSQAPSTRAADDGIEDVNHRR